MRYLVVLVLLSAIAITNGEVRAQDDQTNRAAIGDSSRAQGTSPEEKIDERVRQSLQRNGRAHVMILGKTQLLEGPDAFPAFCQEHKSSKRLELRREVVSRLREIAATEQPAILKAIGNPDRAQQYWLVNAVSAVLTAAEIKTLSQLDEVAYLYLAGQRQLPAPSGKVSEVLPDESFRPFDPQGKRIAWNLSEAGVDKVWKELKVTGSGVTVVSFDSGVNYLHEDLRDHIWTNEGEIPNNDKDDDGNGFIDDLYGYNFAQMTPEVRATGDRQHGTMTTGILVGDGTDGIATGAAPDAQVMIIRSGSTPVLAITAYQYMIENGADVVNMSFSNPNLGQARGFWRRMAEHATCAGLVQGSGAGNFQQSAEIPVQMRVPEDIPCVIAAGGINRQREVVPFSSLGPVEWGSIRFFGDHAMPEGLTKPDVCGFPGPGYPLLGTENTGYIDPNNRTRGNSFSGPLAAGTAALMLSANPNLPAWQVKEIMEATATDISPTGKDTRTGAGLINAFAAVKAAQGEGD